MRNAKVYFLAGLVALFAGILVWKWVSGWGLVTLEFRNAPLAKVIKSIEWQGGVKISTNADTNQLITIFLKKVSPFQAIDNVAALIDADARLAYVAAPGKAQIAEVLTAFNGGTNPGGWYVSSGGFGGGGGPIGSGETFVDPRSIDWGVSEVSDKSLQAFLSQGAQKTGALFAVPQTWNPVLGKLPKSGKVGSVAQDTIKLAKGEVQELFLLTAQPQRPQQAQTADNDGRRWEFSRTVFSPSRGEGGGRRNGNPEWTAERIQSQINSLPVGERAEAQKLFDEMRAFWASVRDLPEEERRQKIEEMMNNSEVQARLEERRDARDAQRSPEQRLNRMRNYVERKQQMQQRTN